MGSRFWRDLDEAQHAQAVAWVCSASEIDPRPGADDECYTTDTGAMRAAQAESVKPGKPAPPPLNICGRCLTGDCAHLQPVLWYNPDGWLYHRRYVNPIVGARWTLLTKTPNNEVK
jgi:hypothetical protein